jgi:hypothetical protein
MVVMDVTSNEVVYETKKLEDLGYHIDSLKVKKRFA